MHKFKQVLLFLFSFFVVYMGDAVAQTVMKIPPRPKHAMEEFGKTVEEVNNARLASLPKSSLEQAKKQANGEYVDFDRNIAGGQIQEAWNNSSPRDGAITYRACVDCVYKIRTREFMTTTIVFPEDVEIKIADLGDKTGFVVTTRGKNLLAVRPTTYGIDTNLNVYTTDGEVYAFYLRSEGFNSKNIPDLVVKITGYTSDFVGWSEEDKNLSEDDKIKTLSLEPPKKKNFIKSYEFNPAKLHGWKDYKLWGDRELRPDTVFRDDHFTYLQFSEKSWKKLSLPTAYVVENGIDEMVNTRVEGTTFIIESIEPLISLKNGEKYLCIKYKGKV